MEAILLFILGAVILIPICILFSVWSGRTIFNAHEKLRNLNKDNNPGNKKHMILIFIRTVILLIIGFYIYKQVLEFLIEITLKR